MYFLLLSLSPLSHSWSYSKANPLQPWNGEYLKTSESAAFLKTRLRGFKRSRRGNFIAGDIVFTLANTQTQQNYTFSQGVQGRGQPKWIWRIPAGSYYLKKISLIDNAGRTLIYRGKGDKIFYMKQYYLSNLGFWTMRPGSKSSIILTIKKAPPYYKHKFSHHAFVALLDGLSGNIQKILGGNSVIKEATNNFGTKDEVRAVFTSSRQVAMFYKINLGRHNKYAPTILKTIQNQEINFRSCYTDALESAPKLSGNVKFLFGINKSNGLIEEIKKRGGSIKNQEMIKCLYYNLGLMQFPVALHMKGTITFIFKVQ